MVQVQVLHFRTFPIRNRRCNLGRKCDEIAAFPGTIVLTCLDALPYRDSR